MKLRWRFGIIAGLFLAMFSLYPQGKLLWNRGGEWNGHYAYNDIDEVAYAGYLKALIDGRPRKNDPYTGRDDSPENPQPESLFSIQFAAPYTVALPARLLGIDSPWAMTISGAVAIFLTGLAIFWLIGMITGDSLYAMADALIVVVFGALFAGEGAIGEILGTSYSYPYFPGFRRYLPAMAMPVFFAMVVMVWKIVSGQRLASSKQETNHELHESHESDQKPRAEDPKPKTESQRPAMLLIALSALAFGYIVFSYFYIWTTAAAWLGCLVVCWLLVRPCGFSRDVKRLAFLGMGCGIFLIPYAWMVADRSRTMDEVQMLVHTHTPDLWRMPALISYGVLVLIAVFVLSGILRLRDRGTLFAISLALTPIAVFNQQVVTGQALQPIHYQVFIGNYVAGLALVVTFALVWRRLKGSEAWQWRATIAGLAAVGVIWGFVECHYTVRILDDVNIIRDEAFPVGKRLAELAKGDPDARHRVVLHLGIAEADDLPTLAPQAVLWARHQHLFAGVTWQENKERYYQQLYYQGVTPLQLAEGMKYEGDIVSVIALFGWGRHTDRLNSEYQPLRFGEVDEEAQRYAAYAASFDAHRPGAVPLDYLIAPAEGFYTVNIDKWYEREEGETFGKYTLYRLTLR
jgi:hypothetical protein